jgi:acetyl-CoA C-acetyltransferase
MPGLDPRQPVIVGAGQVTRRPGAAGDPLSPLELMVAAARAAGEDSGSSRVLDGVRSIDVVDSVSWPVGDPGGGVARSLGLRGAIATSKAATGGDSPIRLLGDVCARVQAGELDCGLLVGAEALHSLARAMRDGRDPGWTDPEEADSGAGRDEAIRQAQESAHPVEQAAGMIAPIMFYPLFESALRGSLGADPASHLKWLGRLWGRFADVARFNPHAWIAEPPLAEEIATPSERNRPVSIPYLKLLNSNIQVDQGAALLICSAGAAEAAGVPRDRWVFPHASAHGADHWFASARDRFDRSPALAACSRAALGHAGLAVDDARHLDLYSCFPVAVQVAARELGVDLEDPARPPSVTGGLTFAGGPGSNYVTHSLAAMTERLRSEPGHGIVTGVGWYLTKHGVTVLSTEAPAAPFAHSVVDVAGSPSREIVAPAEGAATVEAYTAICDREGAPSYAIATFLNDDGARTVAKSGDPATLSLIGDGDALGAAVALDGAGGFALA